MKLDYLQLHDSCGRFSQETVLSVWLTLMEAVVLGVVVVLFMLYNHNIRFDSAGLKTSIKRIHYERLDGVGS